jgi:hypothetical protein
MPASIQTIPNGVSLDPNLQQALERQIAAFLEGMNAGTGGNYTIPDLKYNSAKYRVNFTVTGKNGTTYIIDLNSIA